MHDTRSQRIAEHVALAVARSALTERAYAQHVADIYLERTPLHVRAIEFHVSADPYADAQANAQIVKRMLDGRVRMPVDVEEALMLALPEPYRAHLFAELAERVGLMVGERVPAEAAAQQQQLGALLHEMGHTVDALSRLLDDGVLDERDAPHAPQALRRMEQLQARLAALQEGIRTHVLGVPTIHLRSVS